MVQLFTVYMYVAVNFSFQVIFGFPLFQIHHLTLQLPYPKRLENQN